ncbi:DEAD/DEAH box helicase [Dietzia cinnamea]|uniref:DEAD/DEAH box helicase n=1 Tax=Dietzia cinnamea TaxID=321318 RepID=UPI00223C159B|nr:DEAD/DEAH box helicase [Dietzia cinnamea]MCT1639191.1 DEAD/DEAH box helicase [Dietzia cinnamea]MCT2173248.1 DEAD/DEAH box helicase [Dietzia cinnamea]
MSDPGAVPGPDETTAESAPRPAGGGSLRAWQRTALRKYLMARPKDFLAVATPGAGKTTFGLRVASELLADRTVDAITVVAPTEHLKYQWAASAARSGIALDPEYSNSSGALAPEYHGVVVTYAQVAAHPFKHRERTASRRTLVILDEIHHGGDAKSWGDAIREAFEDAERRLSLTGTPFRSDDSPIPFVTYEPDGQGHQRSKADHSYGYADALADGVVRPVVFLAYSGEARWRSNAGEEFSARLGEPLSADQMSRAWRVALDPHGDWMPAVLQAAHTRLRQIRAGGVPDAGGLVIATDQERARDYAALLTEITGTPPTLVLSDDPTASSRIGTFSDSTDEWMVAVRMVSEGVDVPRLCVGVYATSASTPLYFAQAIGRFVRSRRPGETASVFLPSVPVLLQLASQMEAQRDHVLGKPHREEGLEDQLLAQANQQQDENTEDEEDRGYISLGADAELDQIVYEGSSYGTATFAGSEEEADYIGLPGLLGADDVKALLRQREKEQIKRASAASSSGPGAVAVVGADPSVAGTTLPGNAAGPGAHAGAAAERVTSAAELKDLRRQLNTLVSVYSGRLGKSHGAIHAQLRSVCGGPPVPMASAEQIRERITQLRSW